MAHLQLRIHELPRSDWVVQVAFWADVASVLESAVCVTVVEVHPCLCTSKMSGDSVLCGFGKGGSRPFDFLES